jgi:hypothetical protein
MIDYCGSRRKREKEGGRKREVDSRKLRVEAPVR